MDLTGFEPVTPCLQGGFGGNPDPDGMPENPRQPARFAGIAPRAHLPLPVSNRRQNGQQLTPDYPKTGSCDSGETAAVVSEPCRTGAQGSAAMIRRYSSSVNARSVSLRMAPAPAIARSVVAKASSFGASLIVTIS